MSAEGRPLLSSQTGRRVLPDVGARLGGGSSFHFLSNVIAGPGMLALPIAFQARVGRRACAWRLASAGHARSKP
jgi:hypothetical protein